MTGQERRGCKRRAEILSSYEDMADIHFADIDHEGRFEEVYGFSYSEMRLGGEFLRSREALLAFGRFLKNRSAS